MAGEQSDHKSGPYPNIRQNIELNFKPTTGEVDSSDQR